MIGSEKFIIKLSKIIKNKKKIDNLKKKIDNFLFELNYQKKIIKNIC